MRRALAGKKPALLTFHQVGTSLRAGKGLRGVPKHRDAPIWGSATPELRAAVAAAAFDVEWSYDMPKRPGGHKYLGVWSEGKQSEMLLDEAMRLIKLARARIKNPPRAKRK